MSNIIPFQYEGEDVRTVTDDNGEIFWVAKDVAEILGYKHTVNAIKQHCKGVAKHYPLQTPGGVQDVRIINEPDLYRLIIGSKLASAVKFEKWVFEEVLPTIRKTGAYGMAVRMKVLDDPVALRGLLLSYSEKVLALESKVKQQAPKIAALERIANADGMFCISDAAKNLQMKIKDLFAWMHFQGWIFKRPGSIYWVAKDHVLQQGFLFHRVKTVTQADGTKRVYVSVKVTPKGLVKLALVTDKTIPAEAA